MKRFFLLFFLLFSTFAFAEQKSVDVSKIYGKIKFVDHFADYKVKVVTNFADLHVQKVKSFSDKEGKWEIVESFPDYTIQLVDSFPDFTIKYVKSFPGKLTCRDNPPVVVPTLKSDE